MQYLKRHTFYPFVIYRLILAAVVAVALMAGG
jgi:undecaprenyl pyrophosphate phosphatase UppP